MEKRVSGFSERGSGFEEIMLRKRNRSFQKDQYKGHLMSDSSSESNFQPDFVGQKQKNGSFFSIPGLFVGFNVKGVSDSDSVRSPTSPLDYKFLTNLGNPFRSPSSYQDGTQKSWNCSKVGLGIVDSLNDETKPPGKILGLSKSRNILFGSQMGINIPSSPRVLNNLIDSSMETKSLPKDYAIAPHAQINFPHVQLIGSENEFGTGRIQLEPNPFERNRSCLLDSGKPASPLTSLTYCDPILNSENFCSDEKTRSGSPQIIGGDPDFNNFLGMKPSSLPMSFGSGNGIMGSVSASEIELSEDYTCVITHGPNPKKTHIFGDCILECHANELAICSKKDEQWSGSPWVNKCSGGYLPNHSDDFLSFCYFCKKKLEEGKDIYMYRGDKAFCSSNCRSQVILVEEEMENAENNSSDNSSEPTCCEEIFITGMAVTT
ncbi:Protein of unknown function DUF581 [Macleaya cordata]|uniref:FLZ-type domain-containing protein n=1 Tax=Macleaya cordata TaxID=56857 RepID=A0A200PNW2_MACCD|nr:Protein of unknown function DUF581 [Macleaya cordata]